MSCTKTRRFGGWSNPRRNAYLEQCVRQLDAIAALLSAEACEFGPFVDAADEREGASELCPGCGGEMILQGTREKASWLEVMAAARRPNWYLVPGGREDLPSRAIDV